uniref:Uncharacterized protein n=1 Tax=Globodera pallida TaxID=36090 RepID=A0A183C1B7_GLOPA
MKDLGWRNREIRVRFVGEHNTITTTEEPQSTKPRRTLFRFREEGIYGIKKQGKKDKLARSPTKPGASKQALMACRQIEREPVKDFFNRFTPLAEASAADQGTKILEGAKALCTTGDEQSNGLQLLQ